MLIFVMAKRGRKTKKKQVTYDSKETKFVFGLIVLAICIFTLLSYLIPGDEGIFGLLRSLFGDATIIFSLFLFNLALFLFGVKYIFTKPRSLIAQLLITILIAIGIATGADHLLWRTQSYHGSDGGIIGYEIANFSEQNLLLNLTGFIAFILVLILIPVGIGKNLSEIFNSLQTIIDKISLNLAKIKPNSTKVLPIPTPTLRTDKPAMFGDFRNQAENNSQNEKSQRPNLRAESTIKSSMPDIKIQMVEATDAAVVQSELKYPNWKLPPLDLLDPIPKIEPPKEDVKNNSTIIEQTLASFGIESKVMDVLVGPSVTQYALDIALGIKVSKISNLRNDLALALATSSNAVRIEIPITGTSYVGIEVPNARRRPVYVRELMGDPQMNNPKYALPIAVGKGIAGNAVVADIQQMPHLLIAGATGSGKSVLTNSFILSLLMKRTPDQVRFIMVDPKQVELSDYNGIPHLLTPVITEMDKVGNALKWTVAEMERRLVLFKNSSVRNLEGYNQQLGFAALPYIVIVIDEMADMMLTAGRPEIEINIVRLAQKARAAGIHLILATQRPSVNVITGLIKANIPGRIGMSVTTNIDSRVILDTIGAESLLGRGDLLFKEPDKNKPLRIQGEFVTQEEIQRVVKFIKDQIKEVEYLVDITVSKEDPTIASGNGLMSGDSLFEDAIRVIVSAQKGSASLLQRKLAVGYNRAAKLLDELEEIGVVGPANGAKPREVLITDAEEFITVMKKV